MLKIWFGEFQKGCIRNPDRYFNLHKKASWFASKWVVDVMRDIDGVVSVKGQYLELRNNISISPDYLSSGCKSLILLYVNPLCNVYASRCGDNCAKYILDLSDNQDVVITLHHAMLFPRDFDGIILDTGKRVSSRKEYMEAYIDFKYGNNKLI